MAFYLSPLVAVNEYDATTTIPAVSTSIGAIILRDTYKGPEMKKQFISTVDDLITTFGKPTSASTCYQDILSAVGFLKYSGMLYATRSLPASATFAGVAVEISTSVAISGGPFVKTLAEMETLTEDYGGDIDDFGGTSSEVADFLNVVANSRGVWGNNIRIAIAGKDSYKTYSDLVDSGGIVLTDTSTWSTSAAIGRIDSPIDDDHSFLLVVQVVEQGYSTVEPSAPSAGTSNWTTKEYFNVSLDPNAYDDSGRKKFVETLINETSQYIRVALGDGYTSTTDVSAFKTDTWIKLGGGVGGDVRSLDADLTTPCINALELYENPEEVDINIFIDSNKDDTVKVRMDEISVSRKDVISVLDCPMAVVLANRGNETDDLKEYSTVTLNINSSYSAIYGNWLEVYDKWNGKYRWVPASGYVAGMYANNDYVAEAWFAPAGPNRAVITGVRRLAWNPNLNQRNILYKNKVNPIISLAGMGKLIYGQKTLLDKESAFNRINVRRLFMVLEKAISTAAKYFLFDPNDDISRLLLVNMIDPFLRDVKARRGVYDYMVVCNETNNTPERIDRQELWCDIYIKPTRAAEYIVLNFIGTKTGASFTELSGLVGS